MIFSNAIIDHVPTTILIYGANSAKPEPFAKPYSIYEKIQTTIFLLQEMAISGLYVFETTKILRITAITWRDTNRNMLRHLIVSDRSYLY